MSKVAVIDYDAGNTLSVIKALEFLGMDVELTRDAHKLRRCEKVIFPGVGAYFDAMQKLKEYGLTNTVRSWQRATPLSSGSVSGCSFCSIGVKK